MSARTDLWEPWESNLPGPPGHPYTLFYQDDMLYLAGRTVKREEVCIWKVQRIQSATLTEHVFRIPKNFRISAYRDSMFGVFPSTNPPEKICIRFSSSPAARRAYEHRWHPSQKNHLQQDGSHIVEFHLPITPDFKFWLLSFGHRAEVLEPVELRDVLCKEVVALQNVYTP